MDQATAASNQTTSAANTGANDKRRSAQKWKVELQNAEKELSQKFWVKSRRVIKRYMDDLDPGQTGFSNVMNVDRFNVFWSNVGVLKASLYASPPKPMVKRAFDDFQDDAARVAGIMMQRLLAQGFENYESDINTAFYHCVEDRLVPGLGQVWLRYEPEIRTTEIEAAVVDKKGRTVKEAIVQEEIVNEYVCTDYVYWEDFLWSPCRTWNECRWVARRVWMNKEEFAERFGKAHVEKVNWTKKVPDRYGDRITPDAVGIEKTEVFEIWHKKDRTVCWVSKSCDYYLDEQSDPLELEGFFPCPKPLLATHTTSSMTPKADYLMVQSQYRRLDNLAMRIGLLEDAIQASGVYDKANKELGQLLTGNANKMVPVDNWALFAEKGGLKGVVDWFPLDMVVQALDKLRELFRDAQAQLYELTGISDIMRGVSAPRETYGAQQLKAQYSSVRLQYLQGEVAYFIQCVLRIKADIITKHFQPETIIKNSLIELTPDGDLAIPAVQILKDEWAHCYRVQVFADTLAIPDYNAEQTGRIEFITAAGQFVSQVVPLLQMSPEAGTFMLQVLQWGIASFRSAQSIEGIFDKAIISLQKTVSQPKPPPPPDPNLISANARMMDAQTNRMEAQAEIQGSQGEAQAKIAAETLKTQAKIQGDQAKTQANIAQGQAKTQSDIEQGQAKTIADIFATKMKTQAQIQATREKNRAAIVAQRAKARAGNGSSRG